MQKRLRQPVPSLPQVLTSKVCPQAFSSSSPRAEVVGRSGRSPLERKTVKEPRSWLGTHDATGPDRLCLKARMELTTGRSWPPRKAPDGGRKANLAPFLRKVYGGVLQAGQPHPSAWEGYRATLMGQHIQAHEGQGSD